MGIPRHNLLYLLIVFGLYRAHHEKKAHRKCSDTERTSQPALKDRLISLDISFWSCKLFWQGALWLNCLIPLNAALSIWVIICMYFLIGSCQGKNFAYCEFFHSISILQGGGGECVCRGRVDFWKIAPLGVNYSFKSRVDAIWKG